MAESDAGKTMINSADVDDESRGSLQINISKEHGNWLTVSELIRSIQKPISIYAEEIVKAFHEKLGNDLLRIGKCTSSKDCNQKTRSTDLCKSCQDWFNELAKSHEKGSNPSWHKNCNSARWSEDHWEVAKFFMPALGDNQSTVINAQSTDLSSLLNVLEWMKDTVFLGKTRVNVDLVRKLRSQVRNTWAHAPKHEISDDVKADSFLIATEFLEDLEKVFSKPENEKCLKHLNDLQDNGVSNVFESELQSLLLQRQLLYDIKDEITRMKVEQSSDKRAMEEHRQKLKKLECSLIECSQRMSDFESLIDNNDKQFSDLAGQLKYFRAIPDDIHEISDSIKQIRDHLSMNNRQNVERLPTSCLPEKVPMFTGRQHEIQNVICLLIKEGKAIASVHGGPGFGKTAITVEVSHKLSGDYNIPVIFSHLSTATTVDEMILRLCRDVGVNYEDDPKSSLILWLKNIKEHVVFVFDDIDYLLEKKADLYEFLRLMRKNSNQHCQIVTTSRAFYSIPELSASINISEMDDLSAIELLKQSCPDQNDEFLRKLAQLCGHIPLAICIAGSRVVDFEDPNELLQYLEQQPMKILECPESDLFVCRAIDMSYEMLDDEQKEALVRLAVFEGSFSEYAARAVIEKENLDTKRTLKELIHRSLIKQLILHRYSIHLLIRHFLTSLPESEEKRSHAETLMVEYYLDLGHELTIKSYAKDEYKPNREVLKKEAQNIQNVLQICSQQKVTTSEISTSLSSSKIYTSSARFFSRFVRTVITGSIVDEFLQCCAKLAGDRKELAFKLNFDCLLADQERKKSIGKSDEYFKMMEEIKETFEKHYEDFKYDKSLCAHYYYQYGRYLSLKSHTKHCQDLVTEACEQLEKSFCLRKDSTDSSEGKAAMIFSLLHLGNTWKVKASNERYNNQTEALEESRKAVATYYKEAIELSLTYLGEHELTSACYKTVGDYFLLNRQQNRAEEVYTKAKEMREKLGLDASEKHVYLLNNLAKCLTYTERLNEAIQLLQRACDMAEKLAESEEPNVCKAKVYTSLAIAHHREERYSDNAVTYANKALKFNRIDKVIKKFELKKIQNISTQC